MLSIETFQLNKKSSNNRSDVYGIMFTAVNVFCIPSIKIGYYMNGLTVYSTLI